MDQYTKAIVRTTKVVAASAIFIFGCGPTAGSKGNEEGATKVVRQEAKTPEDYWPLAEGNSWTYDVEESIESAASGASGARSLVTLKVAGIKQTDSGKEAEITVYDEKLQAISRLRIAAGEKGLLQVGITSKGKQHTYSPPIPLLPYPFESGAQVEWTGVGPMPYTFEPGNFTTTVEVVGKRDVDTADQRYEAVGVRTITTLTVDGTEINAEQNAFYSPGVGLVRSVDNVSAARDGKLVGTMRKVMVIRSHTLK